MSRHQYKLAQRRKERGAVKAAVRAQKERDKEIDRKIREIQEGERRERGV